MNEITISLSDETLAGREYARYPVSVQGAGLE